MGKRMTDDPRVLVHYSKDGKVFEYYDRYKDVIMPYAHNMGISKHLDGSISFDDDLYIAYAYHLDGRRIFRNNKLFTTCTYLEFVNHSFMWRWLNIHGRW